MLIKIRSDSHMGALSFGVEKLSSRKARYVWDGKSCFCRRLSILKVKRSNLSKPSCLVAKKGGKKRGFKGNQVSLFFFLRFSGFSKVSQVPDKKDLQVVSV